MVPRSIRRQEACEIFATFGLFLNRVTVRDAFSAVMTRNDNKWGSQSNGAASMHQSTWVVLLVMMFGEITVLALAGFILWVAGEFGDDTPRWRLLRSLRRRRKAP
jgi:hypothetical protein